MRTETLAPRAPEAVAEARTFAICVGGNRTQRKYRNMKVTWEWLVRRFRESVAGSETAAGWEKMTKDQQGAVKDVGAYIGGHLPDGIRKNAAGCTRSLVTLDYDDAIDPDELWERVTRATGGAWALMHSTRSHTPDKPRLRVVVPLDGAHLRVHDHPAFRERERRPEEGAPASMGLGEPGGYGSRGDGPRGGDEEAPGADGPDGARVENLSLRPFTAPIKKEKSR